MLKSTYEQVWMLEPDILDATCKNKFRGLNDVNQYVMSYANFYQNKFVPRSSKYGRYFSVDENREAIRDVGGNYEIIPIRDDALDRWLQIWSSKGIGWVCEVIGKSKIEGYTNTRCFYGSSVYDTAQMSRLISILVDDCKTAGIETLPADELASLLQEK
jgi:hypothetical protein